MRRELRPLFLVLVIPLVALLSGCADNAGSVPAAPTAVLSSVSAASSGVQSSSAAAKSDGCYAVKFDLTSYDGTTWALAGDLEGTSVSQFDEAAGFKSAGVTEHGTGTAIWTITGGVVPGLTTFQTAFDNMNLIKDTPASPWNVFENIGTHRATGGVAKANLSYEGTLTIEVDANGDLTYFLLAHRYWGVICP